MTTSKKTRTKVKVKAAKPHRVRFVRTSVRFPDEVLKAADKLVELHGSDLVDRSKVIRYATYFGLEALLKKPALLTEAARIKFDA